MKLPKRKPTRLKEYDYSTPGMYFITVCVTDKKHLLGRIVGFGDFDEPQMMLSEYGEILDRNINLMDAKYSHMNVDKYVIMPNHIHMIINLYRQSSLCTTASSGNIPQLIKSFKTLVTKEIGYSIWQRSYYDHIIRNYNDYQTRFNYIENNALNWINKYQP